MPSANGIGENHRVKPSVNKIMKWRPRGGLVSDVQYDTYRVDLLCPQMTAPSRTKIPPHMWAQLHEQRGVKSLRKLGREYKVSHETVRRAIMRKPTPETAFRPG